MKKLLLMCCVFLGITAVSYAQGGGRGQMPSPADQAARMKTSLSLNDDQTAKLTVIYTAQAKSRDSLMTAMGDDRSGMRAAMAPISAKYNAQIKAILTPDQATAWQKQMDEARARRQQGGGGGGGNGGGGGGGN